MLQHVQIFQCGCHLALKKIILRFFNVYIFIYLFCSCNLETCFSGLLVECFNLVEKIISDGSEVPSKFLFSEYLELILMMLPSVPNGHRDLLKIVLKTIDLK